MRKTIVQIALIVIVAGVAYLGIFKWDWVASWFQSAKEAAQGYTDAKTPQECLDLFQKAIKDRDYDMAAKYCGGDYHHQIKKAASEAEALGEAIDDLLYVMKDNGVKSPEINFVLFWLDPYPKPISVQIDEKNEASATATITPEVPTNMNRAGLSGLSVDNRMGNILIQGVPGKVTLKNAGKEDEPAWKIHFQMPKTLPASVTFFVDNASNTKNAIDNIKNNMKRDATYRELGSLKSEVTKQLNDAIGINR